MKLNGKTAVVTGGGSGLGAGICRAFAREGATIAVCDIDGSSAERVAGEINGEGMAATTWRFDVCDSDAVEAAARPALASLSRRSLWPRRKSEAGARVACGEAHAVSFALCMFNTHALFCAALGLWSGPRYSTLERAELDGTAKADVKLQAGHKEESIYAVDNRL